MLTIRALHATNVSFLLSTAVLSAPFAFSAAGKQNSCLMECFDIVPGLSAMRSGASGHFIHTLIPGIPEWHVRLSARLSAQVSMFQLVLDMSDNSCMLWGAASLTCHCHALTCQV